MSESAKSKAGPDSTSNREESRTFNPKFGADGLATCVTVDAAGGDVLMVAHMNEAALSATLATGIVHYWSRSRGALWRKGDTSGQTQTLVEMRVDCDQDAFLAFVTVGGDGAPVIPADDRASIGVSRRPAKRLGSSSSKRRQRTPDSQPLGLTASTLHASGTTSR